MNDLMTNLGLNAKTWVGISLSPNNLLELVCLDKTTKAISNYASTDVQYNSAIREIVNEDEFRDGLHTLFNQAELNPKNCNVLLNLPNVHFGISALDANVSEDEVHDVLLSELEDLYIFKKNDPMIEYQPIGRKEDTGELLVVYSAIQRKTIDFIKDCFNEIGATLISVETTNSSLLKGIQYSQFSSFDFSSLNILHINSNSYSIYNLHDNYLIDYYEEPLAIKSFSNEEVYSAISNAASATLSKYNAENLLIISETDEINAELLAAQINFAGNIEFIDRNKWTNGCFIEIMQDVGLMQNQISNISIEVVGTAATMYEDYILSFSFIHDGKIQSYETITIFGQELNFVQYCIVVLIIFFLIAAVIYLLLGMSYSNRADALKKETARIESKNNDLRKQIADARNNKTAQDIFEIAQGVQNTNQNDFAMLNALSTDIPSKVWIEKFMLASDAFTTVIGKSLSSSEIDEFFRNLQQRDPSLKLTKLELNNNDPNYVDGVYNFEMTNDTIVSSALESAMQNNYNYDSPSNLESSAPTMMEDPMMGDPLMPQM